MKKYLIFSLLSLIFSVAQAERVYDIHPTKKIEANPINIAVMLMQENDTAGIASTLKYYGYTLQTPPSGGRGADSGGWWANYTHPNGSSIRYKLNDQNNPTVEVTYKGTAKEKEHNLLENLNFQKNGNSYEQKQIGFTTRCTLAPHNTLLLQRIPKKAP